MEESISFINKKINEVNLKIERNIDDSIDERGYMSQNIIKSLRDLVEYIAFKVYIIESEKKYTEYNHKNNGKAIQYIKGLTKYNFLKNLHALLEIGPSHNSYSEDGSIRLMVKYQEYLLELKERYYEIFNEKILNNIYKFPIYKIDESLKDYYSEIYNELKNIKFDISNNVYGNVYYIKKIKLIVINDKSFYELTLTPATDYVNKFNRMIFYSSIKIPDNYGIKISYLKRNIKSFNSYVEIKIINNYEVFIKPSEINNLYKIFGINKRVSYKAKEYDYFMKYLKNNKCTLIDIIHLNDNNFRMLKEEVSIYNTHHVLQLIELLRNIIVSKQEGYITLTYLIYKLRNSVLIDQISNKKCSILSHLCLNIGCDVFETMPYASSLNGHKVSISDLIEIISPENREHELFGRKINEICSSTNRIYLSFKELGYSNEEGQALVKRFNNKVYYKHTSRILNTLGDNKVYIHGCEESTIQIIKILNSKTEKSYEDYDNMFKIFNTLENYKFTDNLKKSISERIYSNSKIGLIYGSAGTGKTEMIKIISNIFKYKKIAFLAKTNAALNNIKTRVKNSVIADNDFFTIDSFVENHINHKYDLIVVDECSMVENELMLKLLKSNYDCLLLVGDIYQIEAIDFGNWFRFAKELLQDYSYELTENFRTNNNGLKNFWSKVRNLENDITEKTIDENYSEPISESIFNNRQTEEMVLCLNYDGPYGINNINRYLQMKNPSMPVEWGINTYKVNDPIIFSDVRKYSNALYNNLKGKILKIEKNKNYIDFQLFVECYLSEIDAFYNKFKIISRKEGGTTIEIRVLEKEDDDKEDKINYIVPFVVSYAASIHKSQGLEFDSVKIIISTESEEFITKNIFYTAITRAKNYLKIYWSPECQDKVVKNMKNYNLKDDVIIIKNKLKR